MGASLTIKSTIDVSKMASSKLFPPAQKKAAIQMLDWMANGSAGSPLKPPIRTGVMASSGSAFVNGKLIGVTPNKAKEGTPTPNKDYSGKGVAWGFNTDYAKEMHENKGLNPGPFSSRDPNMHPGNQWVSVHLKKDKDNYTALINKFIKGKMK